MYINRSIKSYINLLSSDRPTPGGGGTSALVAALGVSIAIMVAQIAAKRLSGEKRKQLDRTVRHLQRLKKSTSAVIDSDPKVYQEVMASYKRAKGSKQPKLAQHRIETALIRSFCLQADLAAQIFETKQLLSRVGDFAKGSIRNDLIVSSGLLDGAFRGAWATARINVVYMKNSRKRKQLEQTLEKLEEQYRQVHFE
ncbi:MAG: hypothetical protein A3A73_00325 [Omnitrophica bacterium RIFCSPLOWO2_01_FULL_50_24]|nr:MAG: hypothetical protein A3A73_00325 [Omnitrophica bacterium RIFCSPLOWO2_01_FULL_50_24]